MDGWMEGKGAWLAGWVDAWMGDGWVMDGWVGGWMHGWRDGGEGGMASLVNYSNHIVPQGSDGNLKVSDPCPFPHFCFALTKCLLHLGRLSC